MGELYVLEFSNGKKYIGLTTVGAEQRFKQHRRGFCRGKKKLPVYEAWAKYGEPTVRVLAVVEDFDLPDAEVRAIALFNTVVPNGYNVSYGGEVSAMKNPEAARRLSIALSGRKLTTTHRANIAKSHENRTKYAPKGFTHTQETKDKIRAKAIGNTNAAGKPKSEETKRKMSVSIKAALLKRKQLTAAETGVNS